MQEIYYWLILLVILIILEVLTPISIVSCWFIPGAIVGGILSILKVPLIIQIIVFFVISIILLILTKPLSKKLQEKGNPMKEYPYIGVKTYLLSDITDIELGLVKINDIIWNVRSIENEIIKKGEKVEVIRVEGNTLLVKKVKKGEQNKI